VDSLAPKLLDAVDVVVVVVVVGDSGSKGGDEASDLGSNDEDRDK
jgi:hypothetical protein